MVVFKGSGTGAATLNFARLERRFSLFSTLSGSYVFVVNAGSTLNLGTSALTGYQASFTLRRPDWVDSFRGKMESQQEQQQVISGLEDLGLMHQDQQLPIPGNIEPLVASGHQQERWVSVLELI